MSLAALALLAVVTLLARRTVASPVLRRLRVLFPAWRFFDRAVRSPELLIRLADEPAWTAIAPVAGWSRWAFAPAGNLALAYQTVVEQLVSELGQLELEGEAPAPLAVETDPQVVGLVSYELVTRIARAHVPAGAHFQWKIVVPGDPEPEDYLLSPVLA